MSTPRVGCAAISTFGSAVSSRPTISFCWLPPESANAGTVSFGVQHVEPLDDLAAVRLGRAGVDRTARCANCVVVLAAEQRVLPQR